MLKKSITYDDFDGNSLTEVFYFNLTKAEIVELELSEKGGFAEQLKAIVAENDGQVIVESFKRIILLAYGKKSEDGKRFIKSQEIRDEFAQTNAYSELFIELATNADAAAEFMAGIVPTDLLENLTEEQEAIAAKPVVEPVRDISSMSKEELLEALRQREEQ